MQQNQIPTALNTQELMQIILLPEIKILATDQDSLGIFEYFGNTITEDEKRFQLAKTILKTITTQPTELQSIITPLLNEETDLLDILNIINKLTQYGLIEIQY